MGENNALALCGKCLERQQVYEDDGSQPRLEEHTTPHGFTCGGSNSKVVETADGR